MDNLQNGNHPVTDEQTVAPSLPVPQENGVKGEVASPEENESAPQIESDEAPPREPKGSWLGRIRAHFKQPEKTPSSQEILRKQIEQLQQDHAAIVAAKKSREKTILLDLLKPITDQLQQLQNESRGILEAKLLRERTILLDQLKPIQEKLQQEQSEIEKKKAAHQEMIASLQASKIALLQRIEEKKKKIRAEKEKAEKTIAAVKKKMRELVAELRSAGHDVGLEMREVAPPYGVHKKIEGALIFGYDNARIVRSAKTLKFHFRVETRLFRDPFLFSRESTGEGGKGKASGNRSGKKIVTLIDEWIAKNEIPDGKVLDASDKEQRKGQIKALADQLIAHADDSKRFYDIGDAEDRKAWRTCLDEKWISDDLWQNKRISPRAMAAREDALQVSAPHNAEMVKKLERKLSMIEPGLWEETNNDLRGYLAYISNALPSELREKLWEERKNPEAWYEDISESEEYETKEDIYTPDESREWYACIPRQERYVPKENIYTVEENFEYAAALGLLQEVYEAFGHKGNVFANNDSGTNLTQLAEMNGDARGSEPPNFDQDVAKFIERKGIRRGLPRKNSQPEKSAKMAQRPSILKNDATSSRMPSLS